MKKSIGAFLVAVLLFTSVPSFGGAAVTTAAVGVSSAAKAPSPKADYVPDSVLVKFKTAPTIASKNRFAASYDVSAQALGQSTDKTQVCVPVPDGQTADGLIADLRQDPTVASADRNYIRHVSALAVPPNDPEYVLSSSYGSGGANYAYGRSWWLRDSGASAFWSNYNNAADGFPVRAAGDVVKVGVIDTGFYMTHPDKGANIVAGKDEFQSYTNGVFTKDGDVTPAPDTAPGNDLSTAAHGTCVAGEVAASTNNAAGVASVGYDLQVRVYKVMGIWTEGDPSNGYPAGSAIILDQAIVSAIHDATDDGCKVITISLGGPDYSSPMQSAIDYAYSRGVVVCAATGNDGVSTNFYPAANNHVVGVGSYGLDSAGKRARSSFTNYGAQLDVLAPGTMIFGLTAPTYDNDGSGTSYSPGYQWWQGTSMASPAFAGMLAMVWRFAPALTNAEITSCMLDSATAAGTGRPNTDYGYGYANVASAYDKLKADFPYLAKPAVTTTKTAYGPEAVNIAWNAAAGRGVQYRVDRDGGSVATVTVTTGSFTGLTEGVHTVSVTPVSSYNWYDAASDRVVFTFTVDKTAPVVSGFAYHSSSITWADTEGAKSHTTQVSLDSGTTETVTGDVYAIADGVLADGLHTLHLVETDAVGNASPAYSFSFTYVNPTVAPPMYAVYTAYITPFTVTWLSDPAAGYEYVLNGGAPVAVPGGSATLELAAGVNTLRVRGVKAGVASRWVDSAVTYYPPLPAAPAVQEMATASAPMATLVWSTVSGATSYDYRLNGGPLLTTTGTSASVSGLGKGSNTVEVRSRNYSGVSDWTARAFDFVPPVPVAPSASAAVAVASGSVTVSWAPVANATAYRFEINGVVDPATIVGPSAAVAGLGLGENVIRVRALNAYSDEGPWSDPITVARFAPYSLMVAPPTLSVTYGGATAVSVRVRDAAGIGLGDRQVRYQGSYDNKNWFDMATGTTDAFGAAVYTCRPSKSMWVRPVVSAGGYYTDTAGAAIKVSVRPDVGRPSTPPTVRHGRTFTVYGSLKPKQAAGAHNVTVKLYRYRSRKWSYYKTVKSTNTNYGSYTRYTVKTSVPYSGSWRAYAYYAGTSSFVAWTSTYRQFKAR